MTTKSDPITLETVQFRTPCKVPWADMSGDHRVRFCQQCEKHVVNLSAMTRAEAERLLNQAGAKPCVRIFYRSDGSVITREPPPPRAVPRPRISRVRRFRALAAACAAAAIAMIVPRRGNAQTDDLLAVSPYSSKTPTPTPTPSPSVQRTLLPTRPSPSPLPGETALAAGEGSRGEEGPPEAGDPKDDGAPGDRHPSASLAAPQADEPAPEATLFEFEWSSENGGLQDTGYAPAPIQAADFGSASSAPASASPTSTVGPR